MGSEGQQLHIFFFPFMARGHILPLIDTAKLVASRGVKATLVFTPMNAAAFEKPIARLKAAGQPIDLLQVDFPPEAGLSPGEEDPDRINSRESKIKFFRAIATLEKPFQRLVEERLPDCIVSDIFFPWTADIAETAGIPRIVFNGSSFVSVCVFDSLWRYLPHKEIVEEDEVFVIPGLPDPIELTRAQLPPPVKGPTDVSELWRHIRAAGVKSFGLLMNSFYELEHDYVDHVRNFIGKRVWHVGPVSLSGSDRDPAGAPAAGHDCMKWLDGRTPLSVLYLCFGSLCRMAPAQLLEIAAALESTDCSFIWVLKPGESLPAEFEERTAEKGMVIQGWAPQVPILNHPAVGGFVTHCGWNSILEGVAAGVPMITWPAFAEQFFNEKLVTQVKLIGVGVGAGCCGTMGATAGGPVIGREVVAAAVRRVMGEGEETERMRRVAGELGEMAKAAVQKGGSSYDDLNRLIQELKTMAAGTGSKSKCE